MARRHTNIGKPAKSTAAREKRRGMKRQVSRGLGSVRKAFFEREPVEPEEMTPLQKRMQSGGPPIEPMKLK